MKIKQNYWTLYGFLSVAIANIASAQTFTNPLGGTNTFADLVVKLADLLTQIAIPFVVIFLIYAGFLFVSARGNASQITKAKEIFYWTIIGAAVVVGASALAKAAVHFAQSLGTP